MRNAVLQSVCSHRRHLRLDNLRTLVLAGNQLTRIQLATDDDGDGSFNEEEESDWVNSTLLASDWSCVYVNIGFLLAEHCTSGQDKTDVS